MGRFKASVIVTLIETAAFVLGVGVWFKLHDAGHPTLGLVLGTVIWHVITNVEHYVAIVPPGYTPGAEPLVYKLDSK